MVKVSLSHERAITPISDPIHRRIEINLFEREFVDSPYFQRLHFILQNSVSYTTFPANKNTRFPHSLGVAQICGDLFTGALKRSRSVTLHPFLTDAAHFIEKVYLHIHPPPKGMRTTAAKKHFDDLSAAHLKTISGLSGFIHSPIFPNSMKSSTAEAGDSELSFRVDTNTTFGRQAKFTAAFVVDTFWQAVRLYALMHDIGHLPMSHAFEEAMGNQLDLMDSYDTPEEVQAQFRDLYDERKREFTSALSEDDENDRELSKSNYLDLFVYLIGCKKNALETVAFDKAFHEIRGLSLFNRFVKDYQGSFAKEGNDAVDTPIERYAELIQYITLCIFFSSAISEEQLNSSDCGFLLAIKALVDGDFDGDRLDYTLRDGHEAGSDIGKFDLTRVVSNAMLISSKSNGVRRYNFAYYIRALSGVEQFFEQRYQSYKYIIYHRTASRTNACLERLIAQILQYSFIYPVSDIADMLQRFGYIGINGRHIDSLLPDTARNVFKIDDSNLRTLFIQIFDCLHDKAAQTVDGVVSHDVCSLGPIGSDIYNLIRIVAFRDYAHIFDPLKKMSVIEFLRTLDLPDDITDHELKFLVRRLIRKRSAHIENLQRVLSNEAENNGLSRASVFVTKFAPKIFDHVENAKKPIECQLSIVRENGRAVHVSSMSSSLRSMVERKGPESYAKFYIVSNNIKFDKRSRICIMNIINKYVYDVVVEEIKEIRKVNYYV